MTRTLRFALSALTLGLSISCMPKADEEAAPIIEEEELPAPDSYISWRESDNGTFVLDADDEQVEFRKVDGTMVVGGTLVPRFFVLSGFLYHENTRIGRVAYVRSLLETKVTALVDDENDLIDLYLVQGLVQWRSSGIAAPLWDAPVMASRLAMGRSSDGLGTHGSEPLESATDEELDATAPADPWWMCTPMDMGPLPALDVPSKPLATLRDEHKSNAVGEPADTAR